MGRAHAQSRDLDIACVLHANLHKSGMLLSDDSDFLAIFAGIVVPLKTFLFSMHLLLISLNTCIMTKALKMKELRAKSEWSSSSQPLSTPACGWRRVV